MLLRSTLIYAPAILLTRISALLLLVIVTRLIDQTEYGLLTLVVTVGEMTDVAVTNWLRIALLRLGGKGDISRGSLMLAGRVLLASTALALIISVVASAVVVPERWVEFAIAVCSYLIAGSIGRFALTVLQMQQRHSVYSMLEFLRAVLQLALPIGAVVLFQDSFLTVSLGSSLGVLIAGIVAGIMASRRVVAGPPRFTQRSSSSSVCPWSSWRWLASACTAQSAYSSRSITMPAVAIFAAAYALARQPIDMVANSINMVAFPEVVSRFDDDGPAASGRLLSQLMALMIRLCLPVAAMLVALSSDITQLLLPPQYHGRFGLLFPIIAFSVLCANLASFVYGTVVHAHKRPWLLIIANSFGSVATIALSVLLIPPMAEVGAALALAGGSLVGLVACIIISERLTPVPVPWRDIGISIVISLCTGLAASLASAVLGDAPAIFSLAAGGTAGAVVFFGLTWPFYPAAAMLFAAKLRARLRLA